MYFLPEMEEVQIVTRYYSSLVTVIICTTHRAIQCKSHTYSVNLDVQTETQAY